MQENLFVRKFYVQLFFYDASFLKLNIKGRFSGGNSVLVYNLYITILKILVDFILIFWKIHFLLKISCIRKIDVKFFPQKILKRTFFHLNLHEILHLLILNLLVLYLILGSMLNLPYYKHILNPHNCLLKNVNVSIKTTND